ncbi:MAG: hypothetical protein IT205_01730 [Fimbriimonadaceae bacterium]|nr:hypothetical protein [Fimbriimonadaceae bacterium]
MKSITLAGLLVVAVAANAQLVVANDQTGNTTLYYVDVASGAATELFTPANATNMKAWGMAANDAGQKLYWNNGNTLFTCSYDDLRNGNAAGITQVSMSYGTSTTINFVALAYDPVNSRLLGTRNIATESVYEIDPVTGVSTILFGHPTTYDFGGLDCDPANGDIYGLSDGGVAVRGLWRLTDTAQTPVILGYPGTETDIDGLAIGGGESLLRDGRAFDSAIVLQIRHC